MTATFRAPRRFPLLAALLGLAALAAVGAATAPPARAGDAVDDAVKRFKEYLKTKPDSQGKRNAIAELALKKDKRVADAIYPLLRDPDDDVKIAVAENIGKQGDLRYGAALKAMIENKAFRDKPEVVAACIKGLGDLDAKRYYDDILDYGRKYTSTNGDIAGAAFRALGGYPSTQTVDDLIKQLQAATANPPSGKNFSEETRAARNQTAQAIIETLKKVTGRDIGDAKVWNDWWRDNEKTWTPSAADDTTDYASLETFKDDAYGFEISRPNKAWSFRKIQGGAYIVLESLVEGQRAAWLELSVQGVKNLASKTPEAMAREQKEKLEAKFRDIKEADWEHATRISGEKAIEQMVFGRHADHDAVWMKNVYVEKNQVMYLMWGFYKSGKSESLKDDLQKAIDSFKFTR